MHLQKWLGRVGIALVVIGLWPVWAMAAPASQEEIGPNLLVDGDFEAPPTWPMQDGIGEVQVAPGWRAWYLDFPPSYVIPPSSCFNANGSRKDNGCYWMRPEFRDTIKESYANRVHGGERAQKYFSFGRMHEAGLLQQVHNVPIGAKLRFSIHIQAWMCSDAKSGACKGGLLSDAPADMHLRIGIDPTGGTDPFSPNIAWSYEVPAWDYWVRFQVETIAQSSTVTVFTHSRAEWDWARMSNDVYLDDAELVTVGPIPTPAPTETPPGEAQPEAPIQVQAQPEYQPVQPLARPSVRSDGTKVHTIVAGDTLLGIALMYGVTVDEIVAWNNLSPGDYLQIDQELVVNAPPGWTPVQAPANPAPALAAQPAAGQPPAAQPTAVASLAGSPAGLCVTAFDDQNANKLYEDNEDLVAATRFDVMEGSAVVKSYTTDGSSEPYCFFDLKPGTYVVAAHVADGYKATSADKVGVSVAAGQTVNVAFGSTSTGQARASKAGSKSAGSLADAAASPPAANPALRVGGILVGVSGLLVVLVAVAAGVLMSRRG